MTLPLEASADYEEKATSANIGSNEVEYNEDNIRHLDDMEHIRVRSGMYIGRLGDGSQNDDGIYVLLKEVMDNSIDEFKMGAGKRIEVNIEDNLRVSVRDYGRGIPQGKLIEAVSKLNTGGKYDSKAFKKSVGLNGVGIKAVNALSSRFEVRSYRDGKVRTVIFEKGVLQSDVMEDSTEENGTYIFFEPDNTLFLNYSFQNQFVETLLRNYTYLNTGLTFIYNGQRIISRHGLEDLLKDNMTSEGLYDIVHLKGEDIEIAFTHTNQYGEEYYSFVNGQHTTQGGTHQTALKEHIARTIKEFYNKNQDYADIRNGLVAAIAIDVEEPMFESQTKTKLGSNNMWPDGPTVNKYVGDFIKTEVDNFLHKNPLVAEVMLQKIQDSEKERKAIAGVTKLARERAKKANLHNRKLRDCRFHLSDGKGKEQETDSCIFITEGDSASGSITKSRDVNTQAVFSLRGKPLNSYGLTKKVVYENEEFNLLQAALNIEDGIEGLRYNKVIVATDADVDGMHIRLLIITFFLQFFPDLIKKGHVYILQTPLFRVRNKKKTNYCYTEDERIKAIEELGPNPEITRFKGLGEISPDEFKHFIGKDMRLEQVSLRKTDLVKELLEFYMGKNTMERQNFIIDNLVIEEDLAS
ncbi:DNA topoisomerase IV subunit B [Bacteroides eggerthii]|uniref:DNA topoisomerase (ATP-hydrolyzing) n=1 Tax=Bacteroides eggerthii TaxID=28111 RepID=A0A380ZAM3_9BACE|nr:DNA topoisomerase IV subunit B [Bacteroides eggerthii]KAA5270896.1 type IIA DNA topoisomerase subunit B [Bacteroides eggerthii]KAA5285966.1 type IIA DNA topoisomerase subunit B [Bacteroides eggerthii]RYT70352.1 type IIA DNA topoisomerase subunit B [Bacteroides eggerthii]UWN89506.1 type IIA DNA topoisomerase subunit B [Bacteroides eggerthii]SUV43145.1 DNA topoisomerase type IIA subunit B region 2 domain protein [Bacteroides eggerthii]